MSDPEYWNLVLGQIPRVVTDQEQANIQQADFLVRTLVECDRLAEMPCWLRHSPALQRIRKMCERGIWDILDHWNWVNVERIAEQDARQQDEIDRAKATKLRLNKARAEKDAAERAKAPRAWPDK